MNYDFDLFVVGAGSGGVRAGRISASLGARVAVAENRYLGGTCVNVGCVPKKLFVYASQYQYYMEEARGFGWSVSQKGFDWPTLRDKKSDEIARLNTIYQNLLEKSGATLIDGTAKIIDPHTVQVGKQRYSAERILIATGGWPTRPQYEGAEYTLTSNDLFYLDQLPGKIIVEGGGYIAVEFACIYNGFGCDTEIAYRGECFLRGFDDDVRQFVASEVRKKGVRVSFNTQIDSVIKLDNNQLRVRFNNGEERLVDAVLSAIGRRPMTDDLGLENVDIHLNPDGTIPVNKVMQTTVPSVFAIGDVVGRLALTPVALTEGEALARYLFAAKDFDVSYENIPTAMFSQPSVATVGLTEAGARASYGDDITIFTSDFRAMKHTISGLAERTLMKLVVRQSTDEVLGCHMVGENAGEIIQGLAVALNMGATKADFDRTLGIHPTTAEEFVTMR